MTFDVDGEANKDLYGEKVTGIDSRNIGPRAGTQRSVV